MYDKIEQAKLVFFVSNLNQKREDKEHQVYDETEWDRVQTKKGQRITN